MQGYACVVSTPTPLLATGPLASQRLSILAPLELYWDDAAHDTIPRTDGAHPRPQTLGDSPSETFDAGAFVYLVVAIKGVGLGLCKESEYGTLDTLTSSGTWAVIARLYTGRIDIVQQV